MRHLHAALTCSLLLVGAPLALAQQPERYIVVFKPGVDADAAAAALGKEHGFQPGHVYRHALRAAVVPRLGDRAMGLLRADPRVAYLEADQVFHAVGNPTPGIVPGSTLTTHLDRADAEQALEVAHPDDGARTAIGDVRVAVLDTGIAPHAQLTVVAGVRFYNKGPLNVVRDDSPTGYHDGNGHGTHVAGIIAAKDDGVQAVSYPMPGNASVRVSGFAQVVGVAPGAGLIAVKVLGNDGSGYTSGIMAGIDWVVQQRAALGIDVANMSLGGGFSQALNDSVANAVAAGIVFVVAAGNESDDASNHSPASEPSAITVACLSDTDGKSGGAGPGSSYDGRVLSDGTVVSDPDDRRAWFSNYGPLVDVIAPGTDVLSTWHDGGYQVISGTSMASPFVAGAAALAIHEWPAELRGKPAWVAHHLARTGNLGYTDWVAGGPDEPLVDVLAAAASEPQAPAGRTLTALQVGPTSATITVGATQQYSATALYSDGSSEVVTGSVTWSATPTSLASVSASGLVTALAAGSATVAATLDGVVSNAATLTIEPAPPPGETISITKATWSSRKRELVVEATTSGAGPLYVSVDGAPRAAMSYSKGKWVWKLTGVTSKPGTVTVTNQDSTASATAAVGGS